MRFGKPYLFGTSIIGIWLLTIFLVHPAGEFPLNDDWAYAKSVWKLYETGQLSIENWPAMTLIAQIFWGTAFCTIFGLSFLSLRWSTLIMGLLGILIFYALARRFTKNDGLAFFLSLCLWFNPLYLSLSFTFMTDVHFQTAFLLSAYFFTRYIQQQKTGDLLSVAAFSGWATLIRQPGLLIPLVFGGVGLISSKERGWFNKVKWMLPFVFSFLVLWGYNKWLYQAIKSGTNVATISDIWSSILTKTSFHWYSQIVNTLLFPGLFLLPFVVLVLPVLSPFLKKWKWILIAFGGILSLLLFFDYSLFPIGNIFYNLGLGPKILKDAYWNENIHPLLPTGWWHLLKYFAAFGSTGILLLLIRSKVNSSEKLAFLLAGIVYMIFINVIISFFDRYMLPLVVTFGVLILPENYTPSRQNTLIATLVLLIFAGFSITATHDYLSWNRAKWEAYRYLTEDRGIKQNYIDGGFEINAWYQSGPGNPNVKGQKSWWFVSDDDYVLSFGPIEGFEKIKGVPYRRLLPPGTDSIYILWHDTGKVPYDFFPLLCTAEKATADGVYFLSEQHDFQFANANCRSDEKVFSGKYSFKLTKDNPFALTCRFRGIIPGERFVISVWKYGDYDGVGIVFSSDYGNQFYQFENKRIVETSGSWNKLEMDIVLPDRIDFDKIATYLWNAGNETVWLDDFSINRIHPDGIK